MDEGEYLGNDPAWPILAALALTAMRQGNFQLAYLLDTSKGDICQQLRREAIEVDKFWADIAGDPRPRALAA